MKKLALVAILAASAALTGCDITWSEVQADYSLVTSAKVTPQKAAAAVYSFNAVEEVAAAYLGLKRCGSTGASVLCKDPSVFASIKANIPKGQAARDAIVTLLKYKSGAAIPIVNFDTLSTITSAVEIATGAPHAVPPTDDAAMQAVASTPTGS